MNLLSVRGSARSRSGTAASAAVLVLILAACGSSAGATNPPAGATSAAGATAGAVATSDTGQATEGPGPGGGSTAVACDALTDAAIKTATGFGVLNKTSMPTFGDGTGCKWQLDNAGMTPNELIISVYSPGGSEYYDKFFAPYGEAPVAGLGDGAVRSADQGVTAKQGDVMVNAIYFSHPAAENVEVDVVRAVFAGLGG